METEEQKLLNSSNSSITALVPGGVVTTQNISTVIRPKGNSNSLQFVKIQTPELSKKAVEQIRIADETKISKEKIKEVEEEWQNNLLNWKSKRRQQLSHSVDYEPDPGSDNNNDCGTRKVKTFAEMIEQRAKSGNRLSFHLQRYAGTDGDEDDTEKHDDNDNDQENGDDDDDDEVDEEEVGSCSSSSVESGAQPSIEPIPRPPSAQQAKQTSPTIKQQAPQPPVKQTIVQRAPSPVKTIDSPPIPVESIPPPVLPEPSPPPSVNNNQSPSPTRTTIVQRSPPLPIKPLTVKQVVSAPQPPPPPQPQLETIPPPVLPRPSPPVKERSPSPVKKTFPLVKPIPPPNKPNPPTVVRISQPTSQSTTTTTTVHQSSPRSQQNSPAHLLAGHSHAAPHPPPPPPAMRTSTPVMQSSLSSTISQLSLPPVPLPEVTPSPPSHHKAPPKPNREDKDKTVLSISGKKRCSSCKEELGRGAAAFVVESLSLVYHTNCFRCSVCHMTLSNGFQGVDVRVHAGQLHCHNCYSKDGLSYSRV